jgi:hypothetical protein
MLNNKTKMSKEEIQFWIDRWKSLKPSPKRDMVIKIWDSISAAETQLKIYNISAVCKGMQETAGGYKWLYKSKK